MDNSLVKLIHSADPQTRPIVIATFTHVVRQSVRPFVPNFQGKTMFATVGQAEGIIHGIWLVDPRGRPQSLPAGSDHYFHTECPSVRLSVRTSVPIKIKRQSLPAGIVGWPSGSLMTPVLLELILLNYLTWAKVWRFVTSISALRNSVTSVVNRNAITIVTAEFPLTTGSN